MTKDEAISTLEYYKSINFDKSFRSFEDDQLYEALCMAVEGLERKDTVNYIYLITVFDKCEPDARWGYNLGCTRSVGWRPTFELAEETVKTNMCDIWEYCYDYACIEQLDHSLYPWADERWFYKYNRETGHYEEIDEPVFLKNHGPIGGIG